MLRIDELALEVASLELLSSFCFVTSFIHADGVRIWIVHIHMSHTTIYLYPFLLYAKNRGIYHRCIV